MFDLYCVTMIGCIIIGFMLGRIRGFSREGTFYISSDNESCSIALDIPKEEILQYQELVFRVERKDHEND